MTWNLDPPPGFQGLNPYKPVTMHQRHLPHWRQAGATYFVTFRLDDSLPQNKLNEFKAFRKDWDHRNPPPRSESQFDELWREMFLRLDRCLDEGLGSCRLRDNSAAAILGDALRHFDGERHELGCYVVMPNHVHLIVRPFDNDDEALSRITHSWKRYASRKINQLFGIDGRLWQDENYDRIVRDEEHLWRTIQYVNRNPRNAGLARDKYLLWINPAWQTAGWDFTGGG